MHFNRKFFFIALGFMLVAHLLQATITKFGEHKSLTVGLPYPAFESFHVDHTYHYGWNIGSIAIDLVIWLAVIVLVTFLPSILAPATQSGRAGKSSSPTRP